MQCMESFILTRKAGCKSAVYMAGSKRRSDKSGKWKELCKRIVRDHRLCNGNRFWSYNTLLQYETSFNSKRSGIFLYNSGLCRIFNRTGERTITHQSMAASLGIYDIQKGCLIQKLSKSRNGYRNASSGNKRECFVRKDERRCSGSGFSWG